MKMIYMDIRVLQYPYLKILNERNYNILFLKFLLRERMVLRRKLHILLTQYNMSMFYVFSVTNIST